jgi:hypothetical protein
MSILVSLISEFKNKGFKEAEKSAGALSKTFNKLAISLGAALSARKIAQFTKASIKAFVEEDKAVRILANNLQNLGLAYDVAPIEKYIREMQYATGVADNELRPAFQKLTTATRNIATSQELLGLALDISASTGKSLSSVVDGLSRAYLGNNTSLSRLNLGISKADLKTKNFNQITKELSTRFAGSAAKAADTYAGKMAILSAAAGDAQEIIGQKLVRSLEILAGKDQDITKVAKAFEDMGTYVGNVAIGLADMIKSIKTLGGLFPSGASGKDLIQGLPVIGSWLSIFAKRGEKIAGQDEAKRASIARAVAKEQGMLASRNFKTQKAITTELDKQTKLKKEASKLDKAGQMLDLERIQIEAAMQGNLTENERLRLQLMKAILNENENKAASLANKLQQSQLAIQELAFAANTFKPYNPFDAWLDSINAMRAALGANIPAPQGYMSISPNSSLEELAAISTETMNWADLVTKDADLALMAANAAAPSPTITINVTGTGDLSDETKKKIVDTIIDYSAVGYSTSGWYQTTGNIAI